MLQIIILDILYEGIYNIFVIQYMYIMYAYILFYNVRLSIRLVTALIVVLDMLESSR